MSNPSCYGSYSDGTHATHIIFDPKEARTNNEAEYLALIQLLEVIPEEEHALIQTDSRLLIGHIRKAWKVNAKNLMPLHERAAHLLSKHPYVTLVWVPRREIERILGH